MEIDFSDDFDFTEEVQSGFDDPLDSISPSKKNMVLFFVIDTSASMQGRRMETMNRAMQDVLPELIGVGGSNTDIRVAVLTFSSGTEWITSEPMILEEYQHWRNLTAGGVTDLGAAFLELNEKMSRKQFLQSPSLSYAPVIFLITDGCPTDNYRAGLYTLQQNNWFRAGIKIALALGDGVDLNVLEEFTGNREYVAQANDLRQLVSLVQAITVTSSQIGASSMPLDGGSYSPEEDRQVFRTKDDLMMDAMREIKTDIMDGGIDLDWQDGADEGW